MKKYLWVFLMIPLYLTAADVPKVANPNEIPVTTKVPDANKLYPIAVIGSGAAGTMAVKRAVLNNNEVLLFSGAKEDQRRSRGNWVRTVDNVPGLERYQRTILELRNEVLEDLSKGSLGANLFVVKDSIARIEKTNGFFKLTDGKGHHYHAKYVVLATGVMDEQPNIQGSIRPILKFANGQTVAYCLMCDGHRSVGKETVVIGYSEEAATASLLLTEKYPLTSMTLLTNGKEPQIQPETLKKMKDRHIVILKSPILEVLGDREKKQLEGFKLDSGNTVNAQMAFVLLGLRPNNQLAVQLGAKVDAKGLVITDSNGETSVPDLFVDGDLRADSMKQIYSAWQQAVDTIQVINRRLRQ